MVNEPVRCLSLPSCLSGVNHSWDGRQVRITPLFIFLLFTRSTPEIRAGDTGSETLRALRTTDSWQS